MTTAPTLSESLAAVDLVGQVKELENRLTKLQFDRLEAFRHLRNAQESHDWLVQTVAVAKQEAEKAALRVDVAEAHALDCERTAGLWCEMAQDLAALVEEYVPEPYLAGKCKRYLDAFERLLEVCGP